MGGERGGAEKKGVKWGREGGEKILIKSTDLCQENADVSLKEKTDPVAAQCFEMQKYQNMEERKD